MKKRDRREDVEHARACHQRWMARRNRKQEAPEYKEEWYRQQCGACTYFAPLAGLLGDDYGACSNVASMFDGRVMFEHDGCDQFDDAGEWWTERK